MNTAKITLTATVLAAAFGLVLGLSAVPSGSYACHKNTEHGNQTNCGGGGGGGGGGEDATIFEVSVVGLEPGGESPQDCLGITKPPKLDALFGPGCTVFMANDLDLNLFAISVRTRKNGMTDLLIFFTSGDELFPVPFPVPNETVYATDRLGVTVTPPNPEEGDSFLFTMVAEDDDLTKIHQPGKGVVVGKFSLESFSYVPIN